MTDGRTDQRVSEQASRRAARSEPTYSYERHLIWRQSLRTRALIIRRLLHADTHSLAEGRAISPRVLSRLKCRKPTYVTVRRNYNKMSSLSELGAASSVTSFLSALGPSGSRRNGDWTDGRTDALKVKTRRPFATLQVGPN